MTKNRSRRAIMGALLGELESGRATRAFSDGLIDLVDANVREGRCPVTGRLLPPAQYDTHVLDFRTRERVRARKASMKRRDVPVSKWEG